jgi:hypothetical protein
MVVQIMDCKANENESNAFKEIQGDLPHLWGLGEISLHFPAGMHQGL